MVFDNVRIAAWKKAWDCTYVANTTVMGVVSPPLPVACKR
jgi:hypothetical protein